MFRERLMAFHISRLGVWMGGEMCTEGARKEARDWQIRRGQEIREEEMEAVESGKPTKR
jgi:hypothetical protein